MLDPGVTRSSAITISGDVHLILADGASLTATGSGDDEPGIRVEDANSLTIYGQTLGTGALTANGAYRAAGIGGGYQRSGGTVTVNGGIVTANGNKGAGIGGGFDGHGGIITISGGTVTAKGNEESAGIGGGSHGNSGTIHILGGTVIATGGDQGAGIGGGYYGDAETVNISGGTVTANGGENGAGIGSGKRGDAGAVQISGGTVTATGGDNSAGIGSGYFGDAGIVQISGGTVTANGGYSGAGIGGGPLSNGGTVLISGGTVTAKGGSNASGIGGGNNADGGIVYISGGSVKATGGSTGADAIGHGNLCTNSGTLQNNSTDKTPVYLTTVMLEDSSGVSVGAVSISALTTSCAYGVNDMRTDSDGKLYLYLPDGSHTTAAQITGKAWPLFSGGIATTTSGGSGTLTPLVVVEGIEKTSTSGSVDTYTITYSDGSTAAFIITNGENGKSAYELAVEDGYTGTLEAWLTSLAGAAGATGTDGREIELRTSGIYIQWRYSGETEWKNLLALASITGATGATGATGSDGSDGADGEDGLNGANGLNGADGIGISGIEKTATEGNVDTYTIAFTNGATTTFTVTNGKDGAGITKGAINEKGELVFTLTDGTVLNMGQLTAITDGAIPVNGSVLFGKTGANTVIIIAIAVAAIALLSHLGWLIPLLRRKKGV